MPARLARAAVLALLPLAVVSGAPYTTWSDYGGAADSMQYSALKQIFVVTWGDRTVRAFDKDTGKVLWEHELEANPEGIAAVYEVGGRQYVAFCASGGGRAPEGNIAYVAGKIEAQGYYVFALPSQSPTPRAQGPR